jgi:threonine/homoserine/homoserine lactone efflux protein
MNITAFLFYTFLTAYTPGPNNIMSMSNAGKYGFKKGFRFNLGVLFGFLVVMALCGLFTSLLYNFIPRIEPVMVYIGAAYILWLAWSIWRENPHGDKPQALPANSIRSGMLLQFVNVKVILYGITAFSTFILPYYPSYPALAGFGLLLSLIGFSGTCCWALFGVLFERLFREHKKALNTVMALLLVYCAVSLIVK